MSRSLAPIFAALAGACTPVSSTDAPPTGEVTPVRDAASQAPAPAPTPETDQAPAGAAPEVADSALVLGVHVEPGVAPGLAEFAAELDAAHEGQGTLWVGPLDGNGGRDVLVYVPPGADPAAPFELVFHFHGTYSEVVARRRDDMKKKREWVGWDRLVQTTEAVADLQRERPFNVGLVYPISAGKRLEPGHRGWSNVAYDRMWMDPALPPDYRDDFAALYAEATAVLRDQLGVHRSKIPAAVLAEGHSAGGIALLNIAREGSAHVREYLFLDASFQGWADGCFAAVKDSGAPATLTLVVTDKGMADPFEGRDPWCIDAKADAGAWSHHQKWCAKRPDETVPDMDWTCAELEVIAQDWADGQKDWCAALADDMSKVAAVTLVETSVYHKDMPRTYSGGLGLSAHD